VIRLGRLGEEIGFVVKAARPGFWLTSIWFYLVPAGGRNVFHQPEFWLGLLYVTFPLGLLIYGWNDIVDFEVLPVLSSAKVQTRLGPRLAQP